MLIARQNRRVRWPFGTNGEPDLYLWPSSNHSRTFCQNSCPARIPLDSSLAQIASAGRLIARRVADEYVVCHLRFSFLNQNRTRRHRRPDENQGAGKSVVVTQSHRYLVGRALSRHVGMALGETNRASRCENRTYPTLSLFSRSASGALYRRCLWAYTPFFDLEEQAVHTFFVGLSHTNPTVRLGEAR